MNIGYEEMQIFYRKKQTRAKLLQSFTFDELFVRRPPVHVPGRSRSGSELIDLDIEWAV